MRRDSIGGYYVARDTGGSTLDVAVPSGLRDRETVAVTVDGRAGTAPVQNGRVVLALPGRNDAAVAWRITR